jgi:diguanylate cyclase (GGDEF)-like protein
VLNNCRPESALARAEEIRKSICTRPVQTDAGPLEVTMSSGLVLSTDWGHRPAEELIHQADSALYAAKTEGRNRVRLVKPDQQAEVVMGVHTAERLS